MLPALRDMSGNPTRSKGALALAGAGLAGVALALVLVLASASSGSPTTRLCGINSDYTVDTRRSLHGSRRVARDSGVHRR